MTTADPTVLDPRADTLAGIRQFVDWLEQHPELEIPACLTAVSHYATGRAELALIVKALPHARKSFSGEYAGVDARFGKISYHAFTDRERVCRKVVVGTEHVPEKTIPAHERELVEWECEPLLAKLPDREASS